MTTHARYAPKGDFHPQLRERVEAHFQKLHLSPYATPPMVLKTFLILAWFGGSYAALVLWASNPVAIIGCGLSLGLAMAGIGFNIQHDGGHAGYSRHGWVNILTAFALDCVGGSSYVWSWKHNIFHHSHPNVTGLDSDVDVQPFCRLTPAQPLRPMHRFQHFYIWPLYMFLAAKWHFVDDYHDLITGRIGGVKFPRPRGARLVAMLAGKALFMGWVLVLPSFFHPFWQVVLTYLAVSSILSLVLALTFQMAHSVEGAAFPEQDMDGKVDAQWAIHQAEASVDFAPGNAALTWYLGGLNYQIEHHLFPKICHVHLRALAPIVRATCEEFGVRYRVHRSASAALASHARWIYALGRPALTTA